MYTHTHTYIHTGHIIDRYIGIYDRVYDVGDLTRYIRFMHCVIYSGHRRGGHASFMIVFNIFIIIIFLILLFVLYYNNVNRTVGMVWRKKIIIINFDTPRTSDGF